MNTAQFEKIDQPANLWARNGASFYRVTPAKGARIEGVVSVGITSRDQTDYADARPVKVDCPAMWVDLSPTIADDRGGCSSDRLPIIINGKARDERFGATVELIPAGTDDHRDEYYSRITVNGADYFITSRMDSYNSLSDSARKLVYSVIQAIAAKYITDERWRAHLVGQADYQVQRATEDRDKAQQALDAAVTELKALQF
jgi:hypothetical protein